jgi:hypothetical protein
MESFSVLHDRNRGVVKAHRQRHRELGDGPRGMAGHVYRPTSRLFANLGLLEGSNIQIIYKSGPPRQEGAANGVTFYSFLILFIECPVRLIILTIPLIIL